jgi:hypothetical protein
MLWTIVIFIIVVLFYSHLMEQYKKGEELEIYEIDYQDREHLHQVCKSKQPMIFEFSPILSSSHPLNAVSLDILVNKYGKRNVFVKDTDDFSQLDSRQLDGVPLSLESSVKLFSSDTRCHYISDSNREFIDDTVLENWFEEMDEYISPNLTLSKSRDLMFGSHNSSTLLKYNTENCHFIYVVRGKIRVKMTPRKKYIEEVKDYSSYTFYSLLNVWNILEDDFERIQLVDFDVLAGNMLYIPPYWWYSLKYEESDTLLLSTKYSTIMNVVANAYNICNYTIHQYTDGGTVDVKRIITGDETGDNHETRVEETRPEDEAQSRKNEEERILIQSLRTG